MRLLKQRLMPGSKTALVIIVFIAFWSSGCAHSTDRTVQSAAPAVAGDPEAVPDELAQDLPDDDFFEEEEFLDISEIETEKKLVADPFYSFNKAMFLFNDKLYFWVLKPSAKAYRSVTPGFFRTGVRNFFNNIGMPLRLTSCILQGKIKGAGTEAGRFLINSTLGFLGLIDTAGLSFNMKEEDEDLGQVLGKYGIGNGFYLYLPFLGPTTLRDAAGTYGGSYLHPLKYIEDDKTAWVLYGFSSFNAISFSLGSYEAAKSASLDPYVFIRDFYIEYRNKQINE